MSEKNKSILLFVVIYFIIVGTVLLFSRIFFFQNVVFYVDIYIRPTEKLAVFIPKLSRLIYLYSFLHLLLGFLSFWLLKIRTNISSYLIMYEDENSLSPFLPFFWSSIIGLYLFGMYILPMNVFYKRIFFYKEDNIFETMTVILFLISSALLIKSAFVVKKMNKLNSKKSYTYICYIYIIIAVVFFAVAMEEVSWGQRIFNYQTPLYLSKINVQRETNIHNLFPHGFVIIYSIFSIFFITFLFSIWMFHWKDRSDLLNFLIPTPHLYVLAILVAVAGCGMRYGELFEELLSVFVLFYSIRVIKYCRLKYNRLISLSAMKEIKNVQKTAVRS